MNTKKLKSFVNSVFSYGVKFLEENGRGLAVNALAQYLDVPLAYSYRKPITQQFAAIASYPRNAAEAAIDALLVSGKEQWGDSMKERTANEIFKVAMYSDDSTRKYAIQALRDLSKEMWSDCAKRNVNTLITKLALKEGDRKENG